MTFSILTLDQKTGTFAAAAATGSYCVGGWVLRGDIEAGLVASQGTAPSTFWRDDALRLMYAGETAQSAVDNVVSPDAGCATRQMITLDRSGQSAGYTGSESVPYAAHRTSPDLAIAGNMLCGSEVLDAMENAATQKHSDAVAKMFAVLDGAAKVGGDSRGLLSAAILILSPDRPPLDLRIDASDHPIDDLKRLCEKVHKHPYHDWLDEVPVLSDRSRRP